jgi:hypothetical protein
MVEPPPSDATALPDDASAPVWPVLLGVVKGSDAGLDLSGRRYAGAIGSAVTPPRDAGCIALRQTGSISVSVGSETAPMLGVDAGGTTVAGDAAVDGALTLGVSGGAAPTDPSALTLRSQPAPTQPCPWALYRASVPATASSAAQAGTPGFEELRIELPAPPAGPDPTQQAMSVGAQGSGQSFTRTLSLLTDGTVLINGDLHIGGRLATAPAPLDASDPRVRQALLANFVSGVQAGTEALEEHYTGKLTLTSLQLKAAGGAVACTVTLGNIGAVTVDNITVTAAIWPEGAAAPAPDQPLDTAAQLQAQATLNVQGNLTPPGRGAMNVLVRAVGSGLAGTTIQAGDLTGSVKV